MVQQVKCPTLGFCSGHDLTVREFKPHIGPQADSWSLLGILSPSAPPPLVCMRVRTLSLSQNKLKKKKKKKKKQAVPALRRHSVKHKDDRKLHEEVVNVISTGLSTTQSLSVSDVTGMASHLMISTLGLKRPHNWNMSFQTAASKCAKAQGLEKMWPPQELSKGQSEKGCSVPVSAFHQQQMLCLDWAWGSCYDCKTPFGNNYQETLKKNKGLLLSRSENCPRHLGPHSKVEKACTGKGFLLLLGLGAEA